jgi:hypothetical protein
MVLTVGQRREFGAPCGGPIEVLGRIGGGREVSLPVFGASTMRFKPAGLFLRKFVFEFTGQLVYVSCFTKRLNLPLGGIYVHAYVLAEFL